MTGLYSGGNIAHVWTFERYSSIGARKGDLEGCACPAVILEKDVIYLVKTAHGVGHLDDWCSCGGQYTKGTTEGPLLLQESFMEPTCQQSTCLLKFSISAMSSFNSFCSTLFWKLVIILSSALTSYMISLWSVWFKCSCAACECCVVLLHGRGLLVNRAHDVELN